MSDCRVSSSAYHPSLYHILFSLDEWKPKYLSVHRKDLSDFNELWKPIAFQFFQCTNGSLAMREEVTHLIDRGKDSINLLFHTRSMPAGITTNCFLPFFPREYRCTERLGFGREENLSEELRFSLLVVREECNYEGYHLVIITDPRASYQVNTQQVAVNHQQCVWLLTDGIAGRSNCKMTQ